MSPAAPYLDLTAFLLLKSVQLSAEIISGFRRKVSLCSPEIAMGFVIYIATATLNYGADLQKRSAASPPCPLLTLALNYVRHFFFFKSLRL